MKLPFKSIALSTIAHATESKEKLEKALGLLLPDGVEIEREEAEGHYGDTKFILKTDLENRPDIRYFWDRVLELLDDKGIDWLKKNAIDRIADDCRLYLRFDKQFLVADEELRFSDGGDVIHVRINVAAYPAKKEIAVEKMKEFLESGLEYE